MYSVRASHSVPSSQLCGLIVSANGREEGGGARLLCSLLEVDEDGVELERSESLGEGGGRDGENDGEGASGRHQAQRAQRRRRGEGERRGERVMSWMAWA